MRSSSFVATANALSQTELNGSQGRQSHSRMKKLSQAVSLVMLAGIAAPLQAKGLAKESGFSGNFNLSVGHASAESQFSTHDDNRRIDNLDNTGEKVSSGVLYPLFRLNYTTENLKNQFFMGNSRETIGRGQLRYELGYVRALEGNSTFTAAYFAQLPFGNESWEDPYLTGSNREKTDNQVSGGRIEWKDIGQTPLYTSVTAASRSLDSELSGSSAGLSADEQALLQREGNYYQIDTGYRWNFSRKFIFTPAVIYTRGDLDGAALAFDEYKLRWTTTAIMSGSLLNFNVEAGQRRHDEVNPIFGETQEDDLVSVFAAYIKPQPFGWKNTQFTALLGYTSSTSNIAFYDETGSFAAIGLGWDF